MSVKNRARLNVLCTVMQFSLSRRSGSDPRTHGGLSDYAFIETRHPRIGSLVALQSTPITKWYLGWLRDFLQKGDECPVYTVESIEDGELCDWRNVGVLALPTETSDKYPEWQWTDEQFAFNDRWLKVCREERDAYMHLPLQAEFNEGGEVGLGVHTRHGFSDYRPVRWFPKWQKVTKKMMAECYDALVEETNAYDAAKKTVTT